MSTARKVLSNTVAQIAGKVITSLISVVIIKLITNYLGVAGYGQYTAIYEFLAFFGIAADLGLFTIAVREMGKDERKVPFIIGNILTVRTGLAIAILGLAIAAGFLIPQYQGTFIPLGIVIASISVFFTILNGTISSVLQVYFKMQYATFALVIGKLVQLGYMLYVVFLAYQGNLEQGFYQLLWAGVAANGVMLLITAFYTRRLTELKYRFDFIFWKNVVLKAVPYGLALVLNMIYFRINTILLLLIKGPEEVGLYAVPMRVLEILSVIPIYFMNAVLPVLSRHLKEKTEKVKQIFQYSFEFLVMASLPIVVGAQILAYPITFVISSSEFLSRVEEGFYGSDIGLKILVFALLFSFISCLFNFGLIAVNQQNKLLLVNGAGAIFNVVFNLIVIPAYGFRGAAFISIFSEALILVFSYLLFRKYLLVKINLFPVFKILVSALIMGGIVFVLRDWSYQFVQNFNILLLIPLGGVVYGAMLLLTRTVTRETLALFRRK